VSTALTRTDSSLIPFSDERGVRNVLVRAIREHHAKWKARQGQPA
jgi:hypothetical protein